MKVTYMAPLSLLAAMIGFILTCRAQNETLKFARSFFEAAMVGGLADWFAVVALFRHPMNLPIPHTSILKKNRKKITERIVDMLQNKWLTKEAISKKITTYDFSLEVAKFIESEKESSEIKDFVGSLINEVIARVKKSNINFLKFIERINTEISKINLLEPALGAVEKNFDKIRILILTEAEHWLIKPEAGYILKEKIRSVILNYAQKYEMVKTAVEFGETIGVLNYEKITNELVAILLKEISDAKDDAGHEICIQLEKIFKSLLDKLKTNEKLEALPSIIFAMIATNLNIPEVLFKELESCRTDIEDFIYGLVYSYAEALKANESVNGRFNSWAREQISNFVNNNHEEIGKIVHDNIESINDDDLVNQIEEKVGEDLQYIRINGAIVGGIVGTIIYALHRFVLN